MKRLIKITISKLSSITQSFDDPKSPSIVVIFLLLISFVGFFSAAKFGLASLDYYLVRNSIEDWKLQQKPQDKEEYVNVLTAIRRSKYVHGSHPLYADLSGQVIEWGVISGYLGKEQLDIAHNMYFKSAELRPSWPVTWGSLAMIKWRMQEFDSEMTKYIGNANRFGPMNTEVHYFIVKLGLTLYASNHPYFNQLRDVFIERLQLALENGSTRGKVLLLIEQTGTEKNACRWLQKVDGQLKKMGIIC